MEARASHVDFFDTVSRHRGLLWELVRREFTGRYRASFGGILWSLVQPLFLLSVYTFAFGVVLQTRWGFAGDTKQYAFMLFAGLIVFNAFAECLRRAPTLITENVNFVKKIVFPLEILPLVITIAALAHALIGLAVWLAGYVLLFGVPKPTAIYSLLILVVFSPVLLGVAWLLAAVGTIVRDVEQLTALAAHALLFLTPIFYSIEAAPAFIRPMLLANPLTFIVEQFRQVLFIGSAPNFAGLAVYLLIATAFCAACFSVFRRFRPSFADLL